MDRVLFGGCHYFDSEIETKSYEGYYPPWKNLFQNEGENRVFYLPFGKIYSSDYRPSDLENISLDEIVFIIFESKDSILLFFPTKKLFQRRCWKPRHTTYYPFDDTDRWDCPDMTVPSKIDISYKPISDEAKHKFFFRFAEKMPQEINRKMLEYFEENKYENFDPAIITEITEFVCGPKERWPEMNLSINFSEEKVQIEFKDNRLSSAQEDKIEYKNDFLETVQENQTECQVGFLEAIKWTGIPSFLGGVVIIILVATNSIAVDNLLMWGLYLLTLLIIFVMKCSIDNCCQQHDDEINGLNLLQH